MTTTQHVKMTKADLAAHLTEPHPTGILIYPTGAELRRWSKDELERKHDELHGAAA